MSGVTHRDRSARFAALSRPAALGVLALVAASIGLGLAFPAPRLSAGVAGASVNVPLYSGVIDKVRAGQPYEQAAVAAQRSGHFPLRPFVTVRPPLLAVLMARLPNLAAANLLMTLLALTVVAAWSFRLRKVRDKALWLAWTPLIVFTGVAWAMPALRLSLFHECWAGLLIALSLALRTDRRFAVSVIVGLLAALIRELAMPYLLVMAVLALAERRRGEALAFAMALAVSLAALAFHAAAVIALTTGADLASSGWLKLGGWPFVMATAQWNVLALVGGKWAAAVIVPLALAGAAGLKSPLGLRLTTLLAGYTLGFMVIGRPHDTGWGFIDTPLLAVALAFAPLGIADLVRRALGGRPAPAPA